MSLLNGLDKVKSLVLHKAKLVAVTKYASIREINQAVFLGVTDIAESRVAVAKEKKLEIKGEVKLHLIGHLQRNKVRDAVETFDMIQSLDSLALAKKIDSVCKSKNKVMAVLVQVNISNDPNKHGISKNEIVPLLEELSTLSNIKVLGLMTIVLNVSSVKAKPYFDRMKKVFDLIKELNIPNIEMKYLSMGMSNDFLVAIESGANMVRVGSLIFGGPK